MTEEIIKTKVCSKCKQKLSIDKFSKNKTKSDGYQSECKKCRSQMQKEYSAKNREMLNEYNRYYYDIKKSHYIYFVYDSSSNLVPCYVGSCADMYRRYYKHMNSFTNLLDKCDRNITQIKYIEVDNIVDSYNERIYIEHTLINLLQPIHNSICYLPKIDNAAREEELIEEAETILMQLDQLEIYKIN